jgi:allophanate hydrolase subunit 1
MPASGTEMSTSCNADTLSAQVPGLVETSPGVRSCMIEYDPLVLPPAELLVLLDSVEAKLPPLADVKLPIRVLHLPLAFDDKWTRGAIERRVLFRQEIFSLRYLRIKN